MKEWKKVKLGEVCKKVTSGGTPKSSVQAYYTPPTIPWLKTKEVNYNRIYTTEYLISEEGIKHSSAKIIPTNSVIIAMYGEAAGRIAINKIPITTNQACCNLILDESKADYEYIYYYLCTLYAKLTSLRKGAAQTNLSAQVIKDIEIDLPPLAIQHSIATTLSRYDALIANYHRQIKLLEEAAQRLYKEWFVDLHFPGHENVKVIDGVPEGWEKKAITDLLEIKYGKDHKPLKEGTYPVYGTGGVMRYVEKTLYTGESVLIPRKGSLNNIMLVNDSFWTIDTMFYSIPKIKDTAKIAYFYLKGLDMYNLNNGAAVPSMTVQILSTLKLILPSDDIRSVFEQKVSVMYNDIRTLQHSISLLTESRDRLLPKLMSGEVEL